MSFRPISPPVSRSHLDVGPIPGPADGQLGCWPWNPAVVAAASSPAHRMQQQQDRAVTISGNRAAEMAQAEQYVEQLQDRAESISSGSDSDDDFLPSSHHVSCGEGSAGDRRFVAVDDHFRRDRWCPRSMPVDLGHHHL
jgi:hypothetical protein